MRIFFFLLFVISSCSFKNSQIQNQTPKGHEKLYAEPDSVNTKIKSHKRVVIAATNDMEGMYAIQNLKYTDENGEGTVAVGGVDIIASYFKILRQKYQNVLLVDSGDIFSTEVKDAPFISEYYSQLKYDAITVGFSDFNIRMAKQSSNTNFFKEFAAKSKTPLVLSNLYDLKTARNVEWTGAQPYILKEINGAKVGIIGLVPDDVVSQTPVDNRVGLFIENMLQSTLRYARLLRSLGAEVIVVLTPQGLDCGSELASDMKLPLHKVNFEPRAKKVCDVQSALGVYLHRLPPHLVDVVIGGRNHQKVANYVNETLVLSSFGQGKSFSYVEFFIDGKTKKLDKEKTVVHQPVMFCREFFKETDDCYNEDSSVNHKEKIPASFLGETVTGDVETSKKFESYILKNKNVKLMNPKSHIEFVEKTQNAFDSQVTFFKGSTGNSQLVVIELNPTELHRLMEEELNSSQEKFWHPYPFKKEGNNYHLSVKSKNNLVRVLSDLESLQGHHSMKNFINNKKIQSFMTYSFNTIIEDGFDEINTVLAQREY